jgi:hypothetical protein
MEKELSICLHKSCKVDSLWPFGCFPDPMVPWTLTARRKKSDKQSKVTIVQRSSLNIDWLIQPDSWHLQILVDAAQLRVHRPKTKLLCFSLSLSLGSSHVQGMRGHNPWVIGVWVKNTGLTCQAIDWMVLGTEHFLFWYDFAMLWFILNSGFHGYL